MVKDRQNVFRTRSLDTSRVLATTVAEEGRPEVSAKPLAEDQKTTVRRSLDDSVLDPTSTVRRLVSLWVCLRGLVQYLFT